MLTTPLLFVLGASVPALSPVPVSVSPGPSETELPRDLSVWFRTRNLDTLSVQARLFDVATDRAIPMRGEVFMAWHDREGIGPREGVHRFTPLEPLEAGRAYALSWRGASRATPWRAKWCRWTSPATSRPSPPRSPPPRPA